MTVIGMSYERATRARLAELHRQAYLTAQRRQATRRPPERLAAGLRWLAGRLERPRVEPTGPWRDDFWPRAQGA